MYKRASQKAQASARRVTPKQLGDFVTEPTEKERYENLKLKAQTLHRQITELPFGSKERLALNVDYQATCLELAELKKIVKYTFKKDFNNYICDVIKQDVTRAQWHVWLNKAKELQEKDEKENAEKLAKLTESDNGR